MPNSNRRRRPRKPAKPRPDFPLYSHPAGWWAKKVLGRTRYFIKWSEDPKGKAALELWLEQKDDLLAGREPRTNVEGLVVGDLCNEFLAQKESERDNGELSPRTFLTYYGMCSDVCKAFGRNRLVSDLEPNDFRQLRARLAKSRGLVALGNAIQRVKSLFKFAFDEGLVLAPPRYGQGFKKPKKERIDAKREADRAKYGPQMFEAHELRAILASAGLPLRAIVWLAANCAFGQSDLANLPTRAVNLETGWVDFGRGKTGVPRKIPLWPETIAAVRDWLAERPKAKHPADVGLLFLTCRGAKFLRLNAKGHHTDGIGQEFQKLIRRLGLKRPRLGVYSLRHGFETIAGETCDQVAVGRLMGHKDSSMAAHYRERISDERLRRVTDYVRAWLFADAPGDSVQRQAAAVAPPQLSVVG